MKQYLQKSLEYIFPWRKKIDREDFQQWNFHGRKSEITLSILIALAVGAALALMVLA